MNVVCSLIFLRIYEQNKLVEVMLKLLQHMGSTPIRSTMKIKALIVLLFIYCFEALSCSPIVLFIFDGRPKEIKYLNITSKIIHVDIETKNAYIRGDELCIDSIDIFFFPSDFSLLHSFGTRTHKLKTI